MQPVSGLSRSKIAARVRSGEITKIARGIYVWGKPNPRDVLTLLTAKHGCCATGNTAAQLLSEQDLSFPVIVAGPHKMRSGALFTYKRSQVRDHFEYEGLKVHNPLAAAAFAERTQAVEMLEAVYRGRRSRTRLEEDRRKLARLDSRTQEALSEAVLFTDSSAEIKVARGLQDAGMDVECNYFIGVYAWDIVLKDKRIAIEINGRKFHSALDTWIKDHWKNNDAVLRGWRTLRYTGHCVAHHLPAIIEQVRTADQPDFGSAPHQQTGTWHLAVLRLLNPHFFMY
ncbi:hypothetical protein QP414_05390 [Corynebacterium simulans]|uniref:type IV toxin-antitoxin system AbiEi family antitoxin domain-containing protein n=1 Tax=Corynebacterium TaxID=1716 RepID=UPI0007810E7B|nr:MULTISPECIES: type IV toxin-antitoxin system AbiEi family antitoxin domain-containing protein [Corynebacterium]MCG7247745.1 hypothetical protein [Corynebacterium simulans]MDK7138741.1 hypothetical protein [Corynebacterium simulans]OFR39258.1 hypothetical protein HMPREF2888_09480 [Corynebacterium sp. HMSC077D03]OHO70832.1 hypothetical protein HMPREF2692_02335 [Corynebacterium sp. HMSC036D03]